MPNINRTIIIPASLVALARVLAEGMSAGGKGMFETPLYTDGNITHYVSSGWIDDAFDVVLTDANALFYACSGAATMDQCMALINQSVVVNCDVENAQETFARLGVTQQ